MRIDPAGPLRCAGPAIVTQARDPLQPGRLERAPEIRQHAGVLSEAMRARLMRPPRGAPRAYWAARSRIGVGLAWLHGRVVSRRIARALRGRRGVCFAQIGSNDGVRGDPLRRLVLANPEWTGVFAEPVPELFARLRSNYPDARRLRFQQVAVAAKTGRRSLFTVSAHASRALGGRLPSWYDQLGSFDAEHLVAHLGKRIRPFLVAHDVECVSLAELLARSGLGPVDLLHVDAEGSDHEILAQLDLAAHPPSVVLFEHAHLRPEARRALAERLRSAGYRLSRHGGDTLALRSTTQGSDSRRFPRSRRWMRQRSGAAPR
jgi:FkbM family methyltransferase